MRLGISSPRHKSVPQQFIFRFSTIIFARVKIFLLKQQGLRYYLKCTVASLMHFLVKFYVASENTREEVWDGPQSCMCFNLCDSMWAHASNSVELQYVLKCTLHAYSTEGGNPWRLQAKSAPNTFSVGKEPKKMTLQWQWETMRLNIMVP